MQPPIGSCPRPTAPGRPDRHWRSCSRHRTCGGCLPRRHRSPSEGASSAWYPPHRPGVLANRPSNRHGGEQLIVAAARGFHVFHHEEGRIRPALDEFPVHKIVLQDNVLPAQGQRTVGAGAQVQPVIDLFARAGQTRNIPCKYFDVTLYKKGTMHIRFHNEELLERFNIYCSRGKNWLPPNYGKRTYADMPQEEQAVIDSFHGNGEPASGKERYAEILAKRDYYLQAPKQDFPLLTN